MTLPAQRRPSTSGIWIKTHTVEETSQAILGRLGQGTAEAKIASGGSGSITPRRAQPISCDYSGTARSVSVQTGRDDGDGESNDIPFPSPQRIKDVGAGENGTDAKNFDHLLLFPTGRFLGKKNSCLQSRRINPVIHHDSNRRSLSAICRPSHRNNGLSSQSVHQRGRLLPTV